MATRRNCPHFPSASQAAGLEQRERTDVVAGLAPAKRPQGRHHINSISIPYRRLPDLLAQIALQLARRDALLRHGIAVAHGHGAILERLEVDCDAERRPDLVLAAVQP